MTKQPRPRHIRDIAHLYLSRRQGGARAVVSVAVTSSRRECFGGLHVANLAVAFARRKLDVRLYELSGTLPNASFYLAHPPRLYLGTRAWGQDTFHPALAGVSLTFETAPPPAGGSGRPQVHLIHLPALSSGDELWGALERAEGILTADRWTLLVHDAGGADAAAARRLGRRIEPQRAFTMTVGGPGPCPVPGVEHLGGLGVWKPLVVDRVPVVLRNPQARASLEYLSICDSLLSRMNGNARRNRAQDTGVSAGHPAGG